MGGSSGGEAGPAPFSSSVGGLRPLRALCRAHTGQPLAICISGMIRGRLHSPKIISSLGTLLGADMHFAGNFVKFPVKLEIKNKVWRHSLGIIVSSVCLKLHIPL